MVSLVLGTQRLTKELIRLSVNTEKGHRQYPYKLSDNQMTGKSLDWQDKTDINIAENMAKM